MRRPRAQRGATLIELVVSMVIISISVSSLMMLVSNTALHSADPMIRVQAVSIARAYLEEILSQPMTDPSGTDTGGAESGETRASYDDVNDYDGLADTGGAVDQHGNIISGLEGYNVSVSVSAATLNGSPAQRIAVAVSFDGDATRRLSLTTYRMN